MKNLIRKLFHRRRSYGEGHIDGWKVGYSVGLQHAIKPYLVDPLAVMEHMNTKKAKELYAVKN